MAITKDLQPFSLVISISTLFQLMTQDTSQFTSHASSLLSPPNWNFVNHILQVPCDWIRFCDWYALHRAGQQTAQWTCPKPHSPRLPLTAQNGVWPCETILNIEAHLLCCNLRLTSYPICSNFRLQSVSAFLDFSNLRDSFSWLTSPRSFLSSSESSSPFCLTFSPDFPFNWAIPPPCEQGARLGRKCNLLATRWTLLWNAVDKVLKSCVFNPSWQWHVFLCTALTVKVYNVEDFRSEFGTKILSSALKFLKNNIEWSS